MEIYDKLIILYKEISSIYNIFRSEEIEGIFPSKKYQYYIDILKDFLEKEKKLFKELFESDDYEEIKGFIFDGQGSDISRMKDYIKTYETLKFDICGVDDEDAVKGEQATMKLAKLTISCLKNMFLVYGTFFQDYVNYSKDDVMKEKLLRIKYYNIFTKHEMEEVFIDYNFNIPDNYVYVDVYLVAETLGIKISECDEIILENYISSLLNIIMQLMDLDDSSYKDSNVKAVVMNAYFMIEGCLALISDKDYSLNEEKILERIEESRNNTNEKGAEMIMDLIRSRKYCQTKVRKISFRPGVV